MHITYSRGNMANSSLTKESIFLQLESSEQFPINFDDAWQWLGFSKKSHAKQSLLDAGFIENEDLTIERQLGSLAIPRPAEKILLSIDCFKLWAMQCPTEGGKEIRRWYLQVEREWRQQRNEKRQLTQAEIIDLCVLPVPTEWQRRFPEEYYDNLARLTGLTSFGNSRPTLWAQLTKQLVYEYLPMGVYDAVKDCKSATGSYEKLHQFLKEDGLKILEQHQRSLLTLMKASSSIDQLRLLLQQSCTGNYQLVLFDNKTQKK
jgi:phage anti-repressor protein